MKLIEIHHLFKLCREGHEIERQFCALATTAQLMIDVEEHKRYVDNQLILVQYSSHFQSSFLHFYAAILALDVWVQLELQAFNITKMMKGVHVLQQLRGWG